MSQHRCGRLLAVGLVVALIGCGSGGESPGPEGPVAITASPELNGLLDSLCTFMVRAGSYPKKLPCAQGIMGSAARSMIDLTSAIASGTVIYHSDLAAQCAAESLSLPCTRTGYDTLWNDCLLAFEGTIAASGACHVDFECLPGTTCQGACAAWEVLSCCTGTCTAPTATTNPSMTVLVADGDSCAVAGAVCENITSYCQRSGTTCEPRLLVGSRCTYDDSCIGYAFCNGGTCQKRPGLGEICKLAGGGYAKCLPGGCDQTDRCSITNAVVKCF